MVCARVKPTVSGLEQAFPGKVSARNVDAATPGARQAIKDLGFRSHGLVVRAKDGRVLLKQPDHTVDIEAVKRALQAMLRA